MRVHSCRLCVISPGLCLVFGQSASVIARQYHLDARHFVRHNMFEYCRAKMRKRVII